MRNLANYRAREVPFEGVWRFVNSVLDPISSNPVYWRFWSVRV